MSALLRRDTHRAIILDEMQIAARSGFEAMCHDWRVQFTGSLVLGSAAEIRGSRSCFFRAGKKIMPECVRTGHSNRAFIPTETKKRIALQQASQDPISCASEPIKVERPGFINNSTRTLIS